MLLRHFQRLLPRLLLCLMIQVIIEVLNSAFMPGPEQFKYLFYILLPLYLALNTETPFIGPIIFAGHYLHSLFALESWGPGVVASVAVCLVVDQIRENLQLKGGPLTILLIQTLLFVWFFFQAGPLVLKGAEWSELGLRFWGFIPQSLVISFSAPFVFKWLDFIWKGLDERLAEEM